MPLMRFSPLKSSYFQSSNNPSINFSCMFQTNSKYNCLKLINWLLLHSVFNVSFCLPSQFSTLQRKTACSQPKAFIYTIVAEFYGPLLNVFCCNDFSFCYGKLGGPTKKTTFCKNGQLGSELPAPIAKLCWCWNILRKAATLIFLCLVLFWSSHHYDQHEASVRSTDCQDDMFGRWKLLIW